MTRLASPCSRRGLLVGVLVPAAWAGWWPSNSQSPEFSVNAEKLPVLMKTLFMMPQWTPERVLAVSFHVEAGVHGKERSWTKTDLAATSQNKGSLSVGPTTPNVMLTEVRLVTCPHTLSWQQRISLPVRTYEHRDAAVSRWHQQRLVRGHSFRLCLRKETQR